MQWVYLVTAEDRPRVQSRVMQVFDKQLIALDTFVSERIGGQVRMRIGGDTAACAGERLKALLLHVEDVLAVRAMPGEGDTELAEVRESLRRYWPMAETRDEAASMTAGAERWTQAEG